jgi:hypothetical protein
MMDPGTAAGTHLISTTKFECETYIDNAGSHAINEGPSDSIVALISGHSRELFSQRAQVGPVTTNSAFYNASEVTRSKYRPGRKIRPSSYATSQKATVQDIVRISRLLAKVGLFRLHMAHKHGWCFTQLKRLPTVAVPGTYGWKGRKGRRQQINVKDGLPFAEFYPLPDGSTILPSGSLPAAVNIQSIFAIQPGVIRIINTNKLNQKEDGCVPEH